MKVPEWLMCRYFLQRSVAANTLWWKANSKTREKELVTWTILAEFWCVIHHEHPPYRADQTSCYYPAVDFLHLSHVCLGGCTCLKHSNRPYTAEKRAGDIL